MKPVVPLLQQGSTSEYSIMNVLFGAYPSVQYFRVLDALPAVPLPKYWSAAISAITFPGLFVFGNTPPVVLKEN